MRTILMRKDLLLLTLFTMVFSAEVISAETPIDPTIVYNITDRQTGRCLTVSGPARDRTRIVAANCIAGAGNQKWKVEQFPGNIFRISPAADSRQSLDINAQPGTEDGAIAQLFTDWGGRNQRWDITSAEAGFFKIMSKHSNKLLEVNAGPGGPFVQQFRDWEGPNQQWKFTVVPAPRTVMTGFNLNTQGFRFANTFFTDMGAGWHTDGLCGGMMYAAMDYRAFGNRIPTIDFRPSTGSVLQMYLVKRQTDMIVSNFGLFAGMASGSLSIANKKIYFEGGIKDETLREIRRRVDAGTPPILALQNADNFFGHSVLVIGYDMGRYRGDLGANREDVSLYVYDPNHPGEIRIMTPDSAAQRYVYRKALGQGEDTNAKWLTYFVDTRYRSTPPPAIFEPNLGGSDGLVRELRLTLRTGGDELADSFDEVQFTIKIDGRQPQVFNNINNRKGWIAFYDQTVSLTLSSPTRAADIRKFDITKSVNRTVFGAEDLWDLDSVTLDAFGGFAGARRLFKGSAQPLIRFSARSPTFVGQIP